MDDTVDAADLAIARLQEEIANKKAALTQLRKNRNQYVPVVRLLPELLSEIFLYCRDTHTPPIGQRTTPQDWLAIIHTCARWRAVAIACARVWSTLDVRFPQFIRIVRNHFRPAGPLRVVLSQVQHPRKCGPFVEGTAGFLQVRAGGAIAAVTSMPNPITALDLCGTAEELEICLDRLLGKAAGDLNTLRVAVELAGRDKLNDQPVWFGRLGHLAKIEALPKLRMLTLEKINFLWSKTLKSCAATLREVTLRNCAFTADLEVLGQLQCLEKLTTEDTCGLALAKEPWQPVALPVLAELHMREDAVMCVELLRRFRLPSACRIVLDPTILLEADLARLEELVGRIATPCLGTAHIVVDRQGFLLECEVGAGVRSSVQLDPCGDITRPQIVDILAGALREFSPCALDVVVSEHIPAAELAALSAESVRALCVHGSGESPFLPAVAECIVVPAIFPHLERLEVRGADFGLLEPSALEMWESGLAARREVLRIVDIDGCKNVPPALAQ